MSTVTGAPADARLVQDVGGRIVDIAGGVSGGTLYGWRSDEFLGAEALQVVHPDDRRLAETVRHDVRSSGNTQRIHLRIQSAGGRWLWVECTFTVWPTTDGSADTWTAVDLRDISSQHLSDEILGPLLDLRRIMDEADDLDEAWENGLERLAHMAGFGWAAAWERPRGTPLRRRTVVLASCRSTPVHAAPDEIADAWTAAVARWAAGQDEPHPDGRSSMLLPMTAHGDVIAVVQLGAPDHTVSSTSIDIAAEIVARLSDAIRRRQAADELALATQRFELAYNEAAIGMALMAPDGALIDANPSLCRFLGRDRDELVAIGFEALTHPDDIEADRDHIDQMLAGACTTYQMEKRYLRPDDRVIWGLLSVSLVHDVHDEPLHFIAQIQDIDARKRAEIDLSRSEAQFRAAFDRSPIGMAIIEVDSDDAHDGVRSGEIVEINGELDHLAHRLGLDSPNDWSHRFWQHGGLGLRTHLVGSLTNAPVRWECQLAGPNGIRWVRVVAAPSDQSATSGRRMLILQIEDITEHRLAQEELAHNALHDSLTGLPNRALLTSRIQHAQERSSRNGRHVGVLYVDLDNFKDVNDTLGHATGDALLREVAARFSSVIRPTDTASRLGGDEFVVLCEDLSTDRVEAQTELLEVADRLHDTLREPIGDGDAPLFVSASIGSHLVKGTNAPIRETLGNADVAMYRAKALGRSRTAVFDEALRTEALERVKIATELRHAVDRDELTVVYQPIVDMVSGDVAGAEALLRWHHPDLGTVPPSRFIDVAEESNLIVEIGQLVADDVCATLARFPHLRYITMNVSARQLATSDFVGTILEALHRHRVDPERLAVELTENVLIDAVGSSLRQLDDLRERGVGLGVDDFGTGFASLTYLKRLPVTFVKVDRSFVSGLPDNDDDRSIVEAVVGLAHALRLQPIAEGVETEEQAAFLARLNCQLAQGYLFGRPGPAEELDQVDQG